MFTRSLPLVAACATLLNAETAFDEPFTQSFARLDHAPCVSLFYRDGRVGCGTAYPDAQVGELRYFDGENGVPDTNGQPYVAVIEEETLTTQSMDTLLAQRGGVLQGVLVLNASSVEDASSSTYYSPAAKYPQGDGTPSADVNYGNIQYGWNPRGQGLFQLDFHGIPMAYVLDSAVCQSLREQAVNSNDKGGEQDAPIVAEFDYYMGPANMDSAECLAWKDASDGEWNPKCLPLGGTSVWAWGGTPPRTKNGSSQKYSVFLAAAMDSTSLFHDVVPAGNTAASNILTVLMAARLIGQSMTDAQLDNLNRRIVFALFEGESYGFIGSRRFFKDVAYPGFECNQDAVYAVPRLGEKSDMACLHPARHSLQFSLIGANVAGMLAVDQVGRLVGDGTLYAHADEDNDNFGSFLSSILQASGTEDMSVAGASSEDNGNGYPYPPSPVTSLMSLSGGGAGGAGGAILTGYDYAYTNSVPYQSHRDSTDYANLSLDSIAAAATISARAIVAAAYDDGSYDSDTAAQVALNYIPNEVAADDEVLMELADCLLYNSRNCDIFHKYSKVAVQNERIRTGTNIGSASDNLRNFYAGVISRRSGQPFVSVDDKYYGGYKNDGSFGNHGTDAVHVLPQVLESALHGLFDDFLGRGRSIDDGDFVSCRTVSQCSDVDYCGDADNSPNQYNNGATCTAGGQCVCQRAQYHVALDEALVPTANKAPGYFEVDENDAGVSPMYTEPFWSNNVGIRVYRKAHWLPGLAGLVVGVGMGSMSFFAAFVLKVGLRKEKLY